jgi:hypothetical protein
MILLFFLSIKANILGDHIPIYKVNFNIFDFKFFEDQSNIFRYILKF